MDAVPGFSDGRPQVPVVPREQIAHGLAIVYLSNKYGVKVTGEFSVSSSTNFDDVLSDVRGSGEVTTKTLPDVVPEYARVPTGERHLWGLGPNKTTPVATGKYETDDVFEAMIDDYSMAYSRFLKLLEGR